MAFNYNKLLGKMVEKEMTQADLSAIIGMAESTLSLKLNNKSFFSTKEINAICKALDIPKEEIGAYFFTKKV